jgi:hypothetical protein
MKITCLPSEGFANRRKGFGHLRRFPSFSTVNIIGREIQDPDRCMLQRGYRWILPGSNPKSFVSYAFFPTWAGGYHLH